MSDAYDWLLSVYVSALIGRAIRERRRELGNATKQRV